MKFCTDIKQSKKLMEFLPLESADMWWCEDMEIVIATPYMSVFESGEKAYEPSIPCWSLAALLDILPNEISTGNEWQNKYQIDIRKYDGEEKETWYQIAYGNNRGSSGSWHDMINTGEHQNFIDAAVEIIIWLKENEKI